MLPVAERLFHRAVLLLLGDMCLLVLNRVKEGAGLGSSHFAIFGLLRFGDLGRLLILFLPLLPTAKGSLLHRRG